MSPSIPSPPAVLPFSELLVELRDAGLPIGVREHLTVGRLLERWSIPDREELRAALAAVLAGVRKRSSSSGPHSIGSIRWACRRSRR